MLRSIVVALLMVTAGRAQDVAGMDKMVQFYVSEKAFMGSVLVARGGRILLNRGYGFANVEWNIPNAPDTRFRIASLTKQFTAAAVLLMEEHDKLKTDDPVNKFMLDAPPSWNKITLLHLLTHTSGLPNVTALPDAPARKPLPATPEMLIRLFRDRPLDFPPGEKWGYNNSGYILLGHLIEKLNGQSYAEFLHENIFLPLGMKDSGYDCSAEIIPRRAAGYTPATAKGEPVNADFMHMSNVFSAGALYSTTEDLLRWEQGLFGGKVLSGSSLAKMTTPVQNNYGLGVNVRSEGGRKAIDHAGGVNGFNSFMAYYPENRLTVIALANLNGDAPEKIVRQLAALAHGETVIPSGGRKELVD